MFRQRATLHPPLWIYIWFSHLGTKGEFGTLLHRNNNKEATWVDGVQTEWITLHRCHGIWWIGVHSGSVWNARYHGKDDQCDEFKFGSKQMQWNWIFNADDQSYSSAFVSEEPPDLNKPHCWFQKLFWGTKDGDRKWPWMATLQQQVSPSLLQHNSTIGGGGDCSNKSCLVTSRRTIATNVWTNCEVWIVAAGASQVMSSGQWIYCVILWGKAFS